MKMHSLLPTLLSLAVLDGDAFLPTPPSLRTRPPTSATSAAHDERTRGASRLHGLREWRDHARGDDAHPDPRVSSAPADLPVLPFPFTDILLQGQRTQLNLFEQRFHELFRDAVENHHGMVGMGLLAGPGMVTTLPLCEVELFTRFGAEEDWVDRGDGLGNGSIFVTIRAVGRAKIVEELLQEEPYMKARVVEIFDEARAADEEEGTVLAGNIENLLVSLASMEHQLKEMKDMGSGEDPAGEEGMDRRLVNAQLESLFTKDSSEGVVMEAAKGETMDAEDEDEDDDDDDEGIDGEADDAHLDRVAQFQKAFESAKEAETIGDVRRPNDAPDTHAPDTNAPTPAGTRTPVDLAALSWAAFCTGAAGDVHRDVAKIQALDAADVTQRLKLAAAMLGEERKKLKAQMAMVGIKRIMDEDP